MITAQLNNLRQSPRKVRLVASLVKGKDVPAALGTLSFAVKAAAAPLKKLLLGAMKNAENQGLRAEELFVKDFRVDAGQTLKRIMPRARGTAYQILKRTSRVYLALDVRHGAGSLPAASAHGAKEGSRDESPAMSGSKRKRSEGTNDKK